MDQQASRMIPFSAESLTVGQKQELLQLLKSRVGGSPGIPPRPSHQLPLLSTMPSSRLPIPTLPTHSSVPSFANLNNQFKSSSRSPPLLPLPTVTRSRSLPCYSPRKTKTISGQRRRPGLSSNTKDKRSPFPPPPPPVSKAEDKVEEKEEGEIIDDNDEEIFFFTSPPPSSLPLPRFTLKPRKITACSNSSAAGAASDDLRRLLRL